jgi:hypothetical protein
MNPDHSQNWTGGRYIHSRALSWHVRDLLQAVFATELMAPSRCLWLISPWVTDIFVIDNRALSFIALEPSWGQGQVRLSQALLKLLDLGTTIHLATRPDTVTQRFAAQLRSLVAGWEQPPLHIHESSELHEKGILGDTYYLSGSMNFTYHGITLNEEAINFYTDPSVVAQHRITFINRWGGH